MSFDEHLRTQIFWLRDELNELARTESHYEDLWFADAPLDETDLDHWAAVHAEWYDLYATLQDMHRIRWQERVQRMGYR